MSTILENIQEILKTPLRSNRFVVEMSNASLNDAIVKRVASVSIPQISYGMDEKQYNLLTVYVPKLIEKPPLEIEFFESSDLIATSEFYSKIKSYVSFENINRGYISDSTYTIKLFPVKDSSSKENELTYSSTDIHYQYLECFPVSIDGKAFNYEEENPQIMKVRISFKYQSYSIVSS